MTITQELPRRSTKAARRFFERAFNTIKVMPVEVSTDRAATYPVVLEELLPAAWRRTERPRPVVWWK
jgi:transposase-like protein